jgi:hypothetical protein
VSRGNSQLKMIACAVVAVLTLTLGGLWVQDPSGSKSPRSLHDPLHRPFSRASPWNRRIPPRPVLDVRSNDIVSHLTTSSKSPAIANLYDFGVPIFEANPSTPTYSVECTRAWGRCDLEKERVPIPNGARPSAGSDGAMVILDAQSEKSYEFWRAAKKGGRWGTQWGGIVRIDGDGYEPKGNTATGSGVPRVAGVVTTQEILRGHIPHALAFSTDNACRGRSRYPAQNPVGLSSRPDCIPLAARIQLDPTLNLNAIADLTAGEKTVARALQHYGAYAVDNGGAPMAFIFESPVEQRDPYPTVGFTHDYYDMPHIPWNKIRVLRRWDGT